MSDTSQTLVQQLINEGEWPRPQLLDELLDQGKEAVPDLLEIVRRPVQSERDEATLCYAVCLLGSLGDPRAIPDLTALFSRYTNGVLQDVADSLGLLGPEVVEPALAATQNAALPPEARSEAATAALLAAASDPKLRSRVADQLRRLLGDHVARAASLKDDEREMATLLAIDLTNLADAAARPLIDAAFAAGIVDTEFLRPEDVEYFYSQGGEEIERPGPRDWLDEYREEFDAEMESRAEPA